MIDIDDLERIVKAGDRYGYVTPGRTLELIAEVRSLREFHGFFANRCEGLFAQFGMPAIDAYKAINADRAKEKTC
jgi:hypothetical protein